MKVAEIFESLQGEGNNQGRPCLFIRLAGCNLSCRWCDTAYAQQGGTETDCKVVLEQCWRKNPHLVCITGGEPLLQKDALLDLLPSLSMRGIEIEIETNGTIAFTECSRTPPSAWTSNAPHRGRQAILRSLLQSVLKTA